MAQRLLRMLAGARQAGGDPVSDYIARYTMDDATGADETGTYDGTWGGQSISNVTGVLNNAVQLGYVSDSSGSSMTVASFPTAANATNPTTTLSLWLYPESNSGATAQVYIQQEAGFNVYLVSNNLYIGLSGDATTAFPFRYYEPMANIVSLNNWVHICVVWDGTLTTSGTFDIYINGTDRTADFTREVGTNSITETSNTLYVGDRVGGGRYADATLDDIRFYDRALSSTEVTALYNWYLDQQDITTNLNHYWRPSTTLDSTDTVGTRDGTDVGTVSFGADGADYGTGGGNYTTIGTFTPASTTWTYAAWVNIPNLYPGHNNSFLLTHRGSAANTLNAQLYYETIGTPKFIIATGNSASTPFYARTTSSLSPSTWYHVAGTFDGSNLKVYLNGELEDTEPFTGTPVASNQLMAIAAYTPDITNTNYHYEAKYDDMRVYYGKALNGVEVAALYALGRGA